MIDKVCGSNATLAFQSGFNPNFRGVKQVSMEFSVYIYHTQFRKFTKPLNPAVPPI